MIRPLGPLLCLVAFLASVEARAEDWVVLAQGGGATLSLDRDSIATGDGQARYVSRLSYDAPQALTDAADKPATYVELRNRMEMNCAQKTQSPLVGRFYDASGKMVAEIFTPARPQPIVAGSSADWEYKAVCSAPATESSAQVSP